MSPLASAARPHRFNMLLSEDEVTMLHALTELRGLTASDLFRTQLREAFARYARDNDLTVAQGLAVVRERSFSGNRSAARMEAADTAPTRQELRVLTLLANQTAPLKNTDIMQYVNPEIDGVGVSRITSALARRFLIDGTPGGWAITPEGRAEVTALRTRR